MQDLTNHEKSETKYPNTDKYLKDRVRTSRLLGANANLVLHGGGNTSVKVAATDIFGGKESILYVKGSGWDLATIEAEGFSPTKTDYLKKLADLSALTDTEMVVQQRLALTDPFAPNPSVEAILHAIIPFKFVDHTHADAVVTITNTPQGLTHIRKLYGSEVLIMPYIMPGFVLAKAVYEATQAPNFEWAKCKAIILMNHGVFTFADAADQAYSNMLDIVQKADDYLAKFNRALEKGSQPLTLDLKALVKLRKLVSDLKGSPVLMQLDNSRESLEFSLLKDAADLATRGTLTPDHVIRTKPKPIIIDSSSTLKNWVENYAAAYRAYFEKYNDGTLTCLDCAPRWGLWTGLGTFSFGQNIKEIQIINDLKEHTLNAILRAEALESWQPLPLKDLFEVEYWELEQSKLKKQKAKTPFTGRVALVTGAANGIGKAVVEALVEADASVIALDIDPQIEKTFKTKAVLGLYCDVTSISRLKKAVELGLCHFGGLDMLVNNAGIFTPSQSIAELSSTNWEQSLELNLTAFKNLIQIVLPFIKEGINPSVLLIGSKNVKAPGYGAAAYSVAKAGLVQLARIAALELAQYGINVNMVHPDAIYDTKIWTPEVLASRAEHYGLSVEAYKTRNLLKVNIQSQDLAHLAVTLLSPVFSKVTAAQIPFDGGNERII